MKATGIVRRIDDLGRILIPKEIRKSLEWRENDPLELFVKEDKTLCLRKYSPLETVLEEEAEKLLWAFKIVFGGEILVSDSTGRVVASTERTFKGSICISGYGNNISGCFPIAYEAGGFSKRCKGAVFVVGNAESGQQMAKVIALTLAEKLKDYL